MNQAAEKAETELQAALQTIARLQQEKTAPDVSNQVVEQDMPQVESKQVQIEGAFVAKVRGVLPNYVLDDTTPCYVVATQFQSGPFLIRLGALADDVEIGKIYSFEITPEKLGALKSSELDMTLLSAERAIPSYQLQIERFHEVSEEEYSANDCRLTYTVVE